MMIFNMGLLYMGVDKVKDNSAAGEVWRWEWVFYADLTISRFSMNAEKQESVHV